MLELCTLINSNCFLTAADNVDIQLSRGMSRIFERSSYFKRGGVQLSDRGGPVH